MTPSAAGFSGYKAYSSAILPVIDALGLAQTRPQAIDLLGLGRLVRTIVERPWEGEMDDPRCFESLTNKLWPISDHRARY